MTPILKVPLLHNEDWNPLETVGLSHSHLYLENQKKKM